MLLESHGNEALNWTVIYDGHKHLLSRQKSLWQWDSVSEEDEVGGDKRGGS